MRSSTAYSIRTFSYDWETYAPPSTSGNGGLGFIGMQRCLDCSSSPIAELYALWKSQQWASTSFYQDPYPAFSQQLWPCVAVFTLNEPDINGISPDEAASWYIKYINPLVATTLSDVQAYLLICRNKTGYQEGPSCCHLEYSIWSRPELGLSDDHCLWWSVLLRLH